MGFVVHRVLMDTKAPPLKRGVRPPTATPQPPCCRMAAQRQDMNSRQRCRVCQSDTVVRNNAESVGRHAAAEVGQEMPANHKTPKTLLLE